jgi:MarR-like DNA-binding transcriptional regulator SgrR of sgrS sRNA
MCRGRPVVRALVVVTCVSVASVACTGDADDEPSPSPTRGPHAGGAVVLGVLGAPPTIDPYGRRATDLTFFLARPLYPSLFRFNPDGSISAELASSLTAVPGGVRVGVARWSWSNGRPVTARDVVATVQRAKRPSGFAGLRARRVEPRTVELRGSTTNWRRALATAAFVLPGGRRQAAGGVFGGPFVLSKHVPGLKATLTPNEHWAGEQPYLERVTVQFISSLEVMMELLERNRLDAALVPSSVNLDERLRERGIAVSTSLGWETIRLDFRASGLSLTVRREMTSAINRAAIETGLIRDDGRLTNLLHPGPADRRGRGPFADLSGPRARPRGEILVSVPSGDELLGLIQRMMQAQLGRRGLDLELAAADADAIYGGGEDSPGGVVIKRVTGVPGASNGAASLRTLDQFPLFQVETVIARDPRLQNVVTNPTIEGPLWNAERWWWDR